MGKHIGHLDAQGCSISGDVLGTNLEEAQHIGPFSLFRPIAVGGAAMSGTFVHGRMRDFAAMRLRVPLRDRVGCGDPNAAADITQKIIGCGPSHRPDSTGRLSYPACVDVFRHLALALALCVPLAFPLKRASFAKQGAR
jgi:hypothetical protein